MFAWITLNIYYGKENTQCPKACLMLENVAIHCYSFILQMDLGYEIPKPSACINALGGSPHDIAKNLIS